MDDDVPAYTFSVDQTLNKINLVDRGAIEFNMAHELARLRAALAEAERDRDEERAAFDQAHKDALKWIDKAIEVKLAHDDLWEQVKRQRRTIRALVVAARAMDCAGFMKRGNDRWYASVRLWVKDIKRVYAEASNG